MEIREYIKAKRRWLPALLVVPLLAGAAAAGAVSLQAPESTAEVQGYVPPALTNSDSQIGLYIARLNQGLLLGSVQSDVAMQAQIAPDELISIDAVRSGQSDQFVLTAVTTAPAERAVAIAETATKVGTAFVARQANAGADVSTGISRETFQKAQNDLFAYQDEIADLDPNVTYTNVSRSLLAPGPTTDIPALQAQQKELVGKVRRFNELKAVFTTASSSLGAAQSQSTARAAEVIAAQSGSQILYSAFVPQSVASRFLEPAGLALVLAFIAVLGLSLLPDLLRRSPSAPTPSTPAPSTLVPSPFRRDSVDVSAATEPRLTPNGAEARHSAAVTSAAGSYSGRVE